MFALVSWVIALPFAINLIANLIFTPIDFGKRNLPLAAVDIFRNGRLVERAASRKDAG
jgi:tryptophan-rich sensory protein